MKKWLIALLAALLCTSLSAGEIKQFVVFGDSLSDNGNLLTVLKIVPKSPPYYKGRFSNGPNWADHVENYFYKKYFIDTKNYAYGGATAMLHNLVDDNFVAPITLEGELYHYLFQSMLTNRNNTLFAIWIGANDYLYDHQPDVNKLTDNVVNTILSSLRTLIKNGGRHFVVFNLPDLGATPYAINEKLTDRVHTLSIMHNQKLADGIKRIQIENPTVDMVYIDIYSIFSDVMQNPDKYNQLYNKHITDITQPCWLKDWYGKEPQHAPQAKIELQRILLSALTKPFENMDSSAMATNILHSPTLAQALAVSHAYDNGEMPCGNADEHIFWDIIHPTAVVHEVLGLMVVNQLTAAGY